MSSKMYNIFKTSIAIGKQLKQLISSFDMKTENRHCKPANIPQKLLRLRRGLLVFFYIEIVFPSSCDRGVFTDFIFKTKSPVTMKTYWNVGFFRGLCLSVLNLDFITSIGKSNTCRNRFQIPSADRRSLSIDSNWFFSDWGSDDSLENSPFYQELRQTIWT